MPFMCPYGMRGEDRATLTEAAAEEKRIKDLTVPCELTIDLEYLAESYGIQPPYDFELGLSILGSALIMRGRRPKRK